MTNGTQNSSANNLDKFFDFDKRESALYQLWEQADIFRPESSHNQRAPIFNIAMPPPNANGELHIGHALGYTVMDILGRFHRSLGERVLLLPGKDHAGIQTQTVFEKKLRSEKVEVSNKSVTELYKMCYDFCSDRAQYMRAQEKSLGLSADWSRELFTLDPRLTKIVYETFERMWKDGLIYKGNRIVNWSVLSQTSISDVEVEYKEQDGGLWYIAYSLTTKCADSYAHEFALPSGNKIKLGTDKIVTATTRPETMLGDTALAVNADDPRYKHLIGKEAIVPLINRKIPIIADHRVDQTYGTGVIKVTPAHDFTDYDIGQDHHLNVIQVIGKDGCMTNEAGSQYQGMAASKCRDAVLKDLEKLGLLLDTSSIKHKVPISERGKDTIEPLLSEQWFVAVNKPGNSLTQNTLKFLREGRINIYPGRFQVLIEQWLENLRDWNISRQLWWGHRLPVWYKKGTEQKEIFVGSHAPGDSDWEQDQDVFDTWFSSGQWAYSTMAASNLCDLSKPGAESEHFPTHTMVMGRDILPFWACRMLLLTAYRTNNIPWKNIFFTGLIRDEHGQKMSKSKGNGIEPNAVIKKYGTDALRLALVVGSTPGNDISISERKIEGYSKFINKLWNAAKLLEMKLSGLPGLKSNCTPEILLESNRWIIVELSKTHQLVTTKLRSYDISIATDELYGFTWSTFCDWYLEILKVLIDKGTADNANETKYTAILVFRTLLTMLHPIIPYLSEEIYQKLPWLKDNDLLATRAWAFDQPVIQGKSTNMHITMEIVSAIRSVKAALAIPHKRIRVGLNYSCSEEMSLLIRELARVDFCAIDEIDETLALRKPFHGGSIICEVEGKENYRKKLEKDIANNQAIIVSLETKLAGSFATQAKAEIVEKERERLSATKTALCEMQRDLENL